MREREGFFYSTTEHGDMIGDGFGFCFESSVCFYRRRRMQRFFSISSLEREEREKKNNTRSVLAKRLLFILL